MKKFISFIILTAFLSAGLLGVVSGNGSESAYHGSGESTYESGHSQIKTFVILGAASFLNSHADFQLFLHQIEMSGLNGPDYNELKRLLDNAISNMEVSRTLYLVLKNIAGITPYNLQVIDKLKNFDYYGLMKRNKMNPRVFNRVETLLGQGDVTGVYKKIFKDTCKISGALYRVRKALESNAFPEISRVWQLNQIYSDSLFFGQYTAMVFNAL